MTIPGERNNLLRTLWKAETPYIYWRMPWVGYEYCAPEKPQAGFLEAETQAQVLTSGLLALERDHALSGELEACMRAAHSLKGAARIVNLAVGVRVAHAMEECFVAAQKGALTLRKKQIDLLRAFVPNRK